MTREETIGALVEAHFFKCVAEDRYTPSWILRVDQATELLDLRGVDGIAYISYPDRYESVRVPVQIKSREKDVEEYRGKHPELARAGVVILVVRTWDSALKVTSDLQAALVGVRGKRLCFEDVLHELETRPPNEWELKNIPILRHRRMTVGLSEEQAAYHPQPQTLATNWFIRMWKWLIS